MEKVGEITGIRGGKLEVSFCRPKDCGHCHACDGGCTYTPAAAAAGSTAGLPIIIPPAGCPIGG